MSRCLPDKLLLLSSALLLSAGCLFGTYTLPDVRAEIAAEVPRLPVAHLMPGTLRGDARIITLRGMGSLFNDAPLLDENWLHSKMTQAEYVQSISSINEAVGQSLVGLPRMYSRADIQEREEGKATAAANRVAELNAIWQNRGVRFTFQQGREHWNRVDRQTTESYTDTILYLRME